MRESYREGGKVKTRTLANLSRWPEHKVDKLQRALQGVPAATDLAEAFEHPQPAARARGGGALPRRLGRVSRMESRPAQRGLAGDANGCDF